MHDTHGRENMLSCWPPGIECRVQQPLIRLGKDKCGGCECVLDATSVSVTKLWHLASAGGHWHMHRANGMDSQHSTNM
jgi:hypothetical protein